MKRQTFIVTIEGRHDDDPTFADFEVEGALLKVYPLTFDRRDGSHMLTVTERKPANANQGTLVDERLAERHYELENGGI